MFEAFLSAFVFLFKCIMYVLFIVLMLWITMFLWLEVCKFQGGVRVLKFLVFSCKLCKGGIDI